MKESIEFLSADRRVAYYREMAAFALRQARVADDAAAKAAYVDNASRWLALAIEVESVSGRFDDLPEAANSN